MKNKIVVDNKGNSYNEIKNLIRLQGYEIKEFGVSTKQGVDNLEKLKSYISSLDNSGVLFLKLHPEFVLSDIDSEIGKTLIGNLIEEEFVKRKRNFNIQHNIEKYFANQKKIILIDPEKENENLVKECGGEVVYIDSSKTSCINIFELNTNQEELMIEKECEIRGILDYLQQIETPKQFAYTLDMFLDMAIKQKDYLPNVWYEKIIAVLKEYTDKPKKIN